MTDSTCWRVASVYPGPAPAVLRECHVPGQWRFGMDSWNATHSGRTALHFRGLFCSKPCLSELRPPWHLWCYIFSISVAMLSHSGGWGGPGLLVGLWHSAGFSWKENANYQYSKTMCWAYWAPWFAKNQECRFVSISSFYIPVKNSWEGILWWIQGLALWYVRFPGGIPWKYCRLSSRPPQQSESCNKASRDLFASGGFSLQPVKNMQRPRSAIKHNAIKRGTPVLSPRLVSRSTAKSLVQLKYTAEASVPLG